MRCTVGNSEPARGPPNRSVLTFHVSIAIVVTKRDIYIAIVFHGIIYLYREVLSLLV